MGEKKYEKGDTYLQYLLEVMESVYEKNKHPRLSDYSDAVAEKLNERDKNDYESKFPWKVYRGKPRLGKEIHKTVKRKILILEKEGKLISKREGKSVFFYPNTYKYKYHTFSTELSKKVKLEKDHLHKISNTDFVISISDSEDNEIIYDLLKDFIGEENVFSISEIKKGLVLIMLEFADKTKREKCIQSVSSAIKYAYEVQHQKPKEKDPFAEARKRKHEEKKKIKAMQIEKTDNIQNNQE